MAHPRPARSGDPIEVAGAHVGDPVRAGKVIEVLGQPGTPHYRVLWDDGHESIIYPSSDVHVRVGAE